MSRYVSSPDVNVPIPDTGGAPRSPFLCRCIYDIPGSYCFTVPSGVSTIRVVTVGAGGISCTRVGPDEECLPSMTTDGVPDKLICGHDGFIHKITQCIRSISTCADYCNCFACGQSVNIGGCFNCCTPGCCMIHCACYSINPCFRNGVAGAGTTFYYEVCYMSGQSIVAPSGGYADGCLTVTPGCSFTVTVGCVGGTSGFGTYISATGGSVAITQRPKVTCHPINNSCYILCAYDSGGSLVSIAQTNTICCCGTFRISDPNTCFVHNYENCCAQATLTAGVGTAWEGMSNVIVRSGAAGTIFHPDEYSFSGCLTADCCTTTCQASIFTASIVGIACTSSNTFVCVPFHCILTCFGICATTASTKPITVSNYSESFITRCWGGASAGNYFGDGINQSDYDVFCICKIASGIGCLGDFTVNCLASPVCNYVFGPLLTCCGQISNTIECISFSTNFRTPQGIMYECKYGAQGGAGIKSPGTKSLSGSGKAPCVCALTCGVGNTLLFYLCMDDRNGPFQIARTYPPACSCGVICCRVAQDTIDGCDYWYPEDMRGHSNVCLGSPFSNVCGQPGAGGHSNCLYRAGVMGGTVVSYSTGSCWPQKIFDAASTCNCVCGGGSIGFDCYSIYNGHICCSADLRCLNWTTGLVIVYY